MRRLAVLSVVIGLLVAPPLAIAQSNPFGPLPQPVPEATPEPTPAPGSPQAQVSRTTLALIGLGVLLLFVAVGWAITRDARRNLTEEDRAALERETSGAAGRTKPPAGKAKAKARQKGKAQRQARRRARR